MRGGGLKVLATTGGGVNRKDPKKSFFPNYFEILFLDTVPTSFTIDMESTVIRSYSIVLCFNNRPFGADSLLDKFVLLVGAEGANESQILANVETS